MKNCPWFMDKTILTFLFIIGWIAVPTTADQSYVYYEDNEYDDYGNGGMAEMDYISNLQTNTVFISKPIEVLRNPGDSVRLPCIVDRLESYVVMWRKDRNMITMGNQVFNQVDGRIKLEEERNGNYLVISSAEESDAGEYVCEISTSNPMELIHSVIIRVNPVISLTPKNGLLTVTEGDSATLACHAIAGIPSPLITWRKRDGLIPGPVNSFITGNMTHMQDMSMIPGNVISFDSVSRNQSGYYVCSATQPQQFGPPVIVTAELQLDVQQRCYDCLNSVDVVAPQNVVQGEDAILECRFDLPEQRIYNVKWYKDEKEFYRYTPTDNPSLRIFNLPGVHVKTLNPAISKTTINLKNVDLSTSGSYKCEVSADAPIFITKHGIKDLNVVARNSVDIVAPENVVQGEDAILECTFDLPEQSIIYSVKWYKDHKEFYRYIPSNSPSPRIFKLAGVHVETLSLASSETTINLKNVDLSTSGSYRCEVSLDSPSFITKYGDKNLNVVAPQNIPQDEEKYSTAVNVSERIAEKLIQHDNETFDLYVDASKHFAKMIDIGIPDDLLKSLENPEEYKIVTKQSAISSSLSASTSTTAPPAGCYDCFSVDVVAPENVVPGEDAILECRFDVPGIIYSVKWYKDVHEFYRYLPSESPSLRIRILELPGVHVDRSNQTLSASTIYLKNVDLSTSGSYKCEVSQEAPTFLTKHGVKHLNVIAPRKILQDDEKYAIAMNVSELIAKKLIQHDNETFDLYVDASKNFAKMIDIGVPEDLLKYMENPEEFKIVTRQSAISSSSSASTSTTAPPPTTAVSPTISIGEPVVGGYLGKFVMLECEVSAWPKPVNYWEKDGRYLTSGARHQIKEVKAREIYKYRMILNVTLVSHDDVGTYYCVSKNKMGSSRGSIQVYKRGFLFGPNGGRIRAYPRYRVGIDFRVSMWIKPTNVTGLLLGVKGRRDEVILEMVNGEIIFSVDNGRGPMIANFKPEYPDYLCNGEWHKVEAVKSKNVATVAVDNIFAAPALGPPGVDSTDTNNPLFIGGHERPATLRLMRADSNFEGCIRDVSIENNDLIVTDDMLFGDITADVCPLY